MRAISRISTVHVSGSTNISIGISSAASEVLMQSSGREASCDAAV
ncbi:MAG: hypothetical protein R3F55_09960 [Alphaproteobacteria bacterium]